MIKWFTVNSPKEERSLFFQTISEKSSSRTRNLLVALALMQIIQMLLYITKTESILNDRELILIKLFIVVFSILSYFILKFLSREESRCRRLVEPVLTGIVFVILCWSVVNTFKAQSITSDISIYILALFAIATVVRLRPWMAIAMYGTMYTFFVIGLPHFQPNHEYLVSHTINGLILNIIAFLINLMMFRYSFIEYQEMQKVNSKNSELLHLSRHDGLTSLYNHLTIHELLESAIVHARDTSEALSIMLIDLDHFKELNDAYGHRTGDTVLRDVSESIIENIRESDMAGRYGGDEFLIVLPGSTTSKAKEIALRLLNEIRQLDFNGMNLSFSCGIAQWNGDSTEQFIDKADKVLYRVKSDGRNNVYA